MGAAHAIVEQLVPDLDMHVDAALSEEIRSRLYQGCRFKGKANLHAQRRALDLQVLDHGDRIAVVKLIAIGLSNGSPGRGGLFGRILVPLMGAFRADVKGSVLVGERRPALGALGQPALVNAISDGNC